jgi:dienelactone hydrolase
MSDLEQLAYRDGETALTGLLARPSGKVRGGIVVFPTIMNANPHMERRALMLAAEGYLVLIADFYGVRPSSFGQAGELAAKLRETPENYRNRLRAATVALGRQCDTYGVPMGAIGYCMGGQAALEAARDGTDLKLVASFHGLLDTKAPAKPNSIKPRLLVCHGDADPMVSHEQVLAFWNEMNAAEADWHFHSYSGVRHGFTDPESDARGLPAIAYNASADRQSWAALMAILGEVL